MRTAITLILVLASVAGCGARRHTPAARAISASDDTAFLQYAGMRARGGAELSEFASREGSTEQVRQAAREVLTDQREILNSVAVLSKQRQVVVPTYPATEQQRAIERMGKLSGPEFDREYLVSITASLEADLPAFQNAARTARARAVRSAAAELEPLLHRDLAILQALGANARARSTPRTNESEPADQVSAGPQDQR